MSFSFGFSGDDIEEDPSDVQTSNEQTSAQTAESCPPPIPAKAHDLDEMLATLPDKLSFTLHPTTSPAGTTVLLPRRDLFDIRLQLMAEDDPSLSSAAQPTGLDASDIHTNVYEGGYKTWECSLDLLRFLLDRGPRKDLDDMARVQHVVEMGCGTAVPSCLLFKWALENRPSAGMQFTLTDYNDDVLRLVSVPNLLLTWVGTLPATAAPFSNDAPNPLLVAREDGNAGEDMSGELYMTPEIISAFKNALRESGILISLISGSWTPTQKLLELVPSVPELDTLVLASETIYSPASLSAFTEAMVALLKRVKSGKALAAAKRVYFGVGGSVDGFREECSRLGCVAYEIDFEGLESGGVRRALLEVQMY